jgi:hypothetical protein
MNSATTKDLNSKPKRGFYFPIEFKNTIKMVRDLDLKTDEKERFRVRFKNIDKKESESQRILRFYPGVCVSVYSVPENKAARLKEAHYKKIMEYLAPFKWKFENTKEVEVFYEAGLIESKGEITVLKVSERYQTKFEFRSKASHRSTSKLTKRIEEILNVWQLD